MSPGRFLKRAAGVALVAAAAFYLGRTIVDHWSELRAFRWQIDRTLLFASVIVHIGVLAWGVWLWSLVLARLTDLRPDLLSLQRIWFLSNLARYIPGKIFQFVAAAHLGRGAGVAGRLVLTSMLLHVGFSLLSALLVSAATLGGRILPAVDPIVMGLTSGLLAAAAVHPGVLNALVRLGSRLLRRDLSRWTGTWGTGLLLLGLSVVSWLLYGIAYHLFVAALVGVPWRLYLQMTGVNALSFFIGYISVLPGGIGLREVAMAELLVPYAPAGVAAVLAIAARLWTIVAELLGALIAIALPGRAESGVSPPTEPLLTDEQPSRNST